MAVPFEIRHTTTYKYANPVSFGAHQAMFLPRPPQFADACSVGP
jgi:hypothetical protein